MDADARSAGGLHVERRQDTGGELRRAAAIDQIEHRVQIKPTIARQPGRVDVVKPGALQPAPSPIDHAERGSSA